MTLRPRRPRSITERFDWASCRQLFRGRKSEVSQSLKLQWLSTFLRAYLIRVESKGFPTVYGGARLMLRPYLSPAGIPIVAVEARNPGAPSVYRRDRDQH
jgi:hypothetical protein